MNKEVFQTFAGKQLRKPDARNSEGAPAYEFPARHALAQYAATGCLNQTFYATAAMQLEAVLQLASEVPPQFVAKTAVYCREQGFMKDMPVLLCALLTVQEPALCERIFDRVIDDGKMLRNFVQVVRSGHVGRKSLGSFPKRLVRRWLAQRDDDALFRASIGQDPSLVDVIKMAHPRPDTASRRALYAWLIGKPHDGQHLPALVRDFEAYKAHGGAAPNVPFQMLTALALDGAAWRAVAANATWQQTRLNLATFARHGVFTSKKMTALVAEKLRDREAIKRSRVLPYQLMTAFLATGHDVPELVRAALEDAMDVALENVPRLDGKVYVACDVSGSMASPVTGYRRGATTKARCVDVAALVAAALMRNNDCEVLPFENDVVKLRLSRRDSVMTNARKLASVGGGGTNCSAPLARLNDARARGNLVVYVSDNESWIDARAYYGTETMRQWQMFKSRNPQAKLACIDLTPNRTTQAYEDESILNVGGFSDAVFELLGEFAKGGLSPGHWTDVIEAVRL
jgi:60 kDa SS-A/Ro ribonucleoprotein